MKALICGIAAVLVLSGCGGAAETDDSLGTGPRITLTPTATVDAFDAATPVDPADYGPPWFDDDPATVDGVDFDSPDHTIHCGIYDPYFPSSPYTAAPFAGCQPDARDFDFPAVMNDGYGYGYASAVTQEGMEESAAVWMTDQEFAFESKVLAAGTSITWSTVTCASVDDGIECRNSASGYGFFISRDRYEVDKEAPEQFNDDYVQDKSDAYLVDEGDINWATEWLTPSGNVACAIIPRVNQPWTLECRAAEHSWSGSGIRITGDELPQPTPAGEPDYVAGQVLAGSSAHAITVLPYGHFVHIGDFRCVSLDTGLTCENWYSHHGFTISKSKLETH